MKHLFTQTMLFILSIVLLTSCNPNSAIKECEDPQEVVEEDFFMNEILEPNDYARQSCGLIVASIVPDILENYKDSVNLHIECDALWNVANKKILDSSSIKIISIDTTWLCLTFNEGERDEFQLRFGKNIAYSSLSNLLMSVLDSCTYSMNLKYCGEATFADVISCYLDSLATSRIDFNVILYQS